jgi:ElaB/YqjD/DUF883 family membrane-anchored ribosome-binding protein
MSDVYAVPKEKLMADLRAVVADAEDLLRVTANQAGDGVAELRAKVQANLHSAKSNLLDAQAAVLDQAKEAGKVADQYVHENPWKSVGIAAGVGLLMGLLIARR